MAANMGRLSVLTGQTVVLKLRLRNAAGTYEDLTGRVFAVALKDRAGATVAAYASSVAVEDGYSTATMAVPGDKNTELLERRGQTEEYDAFVVEVVAGSYYPLVEGTWALRRGPDPAELPGETPEATDGPATLLTLIGDGEWLITVETAGPRGQRGEKGWSPLLTVEEDGQRRVLKVYGWAGGEGEAPAAPKYVATDGDLVDAIGDGADIVGGLADLLASVGTDADRAEAAMVRAEATIINRRAGKRAAGILREFSVASGGEIVRLFYVDEDLALVAPDIQGPFRDEMEARLAAAREERALHRVGAREPGVVQSFNVRRPDGSLVSWLTLTDDFELDAPPLTGAALAALEARFGIGGAANPVHRVGKRGGGGLQSFAVRRPDGSLVQWLGLTDQFKVDMPPLTGSALADLEARFTVARAGSGGRRGVRDGWAVRYEDARGMVGGWGRDRAWYVGQTNPDYAAVVDTGADGAPQVFAVGPGLLQQISYVPGGVFSAPVAMTEPPSAAEVRAVAVARRERRVGGRANVQFNWRPEDWPAAEADDGSAWLVLADGQSLSPIGYDRHVVVDQPLDGQVYGFSTSADDLSNRGLSPTNNSAAAGTPDPWDRNVDPAYLEYLTPAYEMFRAGGGADDDQDGFGDGKGESGLTALGFLLRRRAYRQRGPVVVSSFGAGGTSYEQHKKLGTSAFYDNQLAAVERFVALCGESAGNPLAGRTPLIDMAIYIQGDADASAGAAPGEYLARLTEHVANINADWPALTGQAGPIMLYVEQTEHRANDPTYGYLAGSPVTLDQLAAGLDPDLLITCIGPPYWKTTQGDDTHWVADDYLHTTAYIARAHTEWLATGQKRRPLFVEEATIDGRWVMLRFNADRANAASPLVIDDRSVVDPGFYGVTVRTGGVLNVLAGRPEVVGVDTLAVPTAAALAGSGVTVSVAYEGGGAAGRTTGRRSCIRNASRDLNPVTGRPLHDWASQQLVNIN